MDAADFFADTTGNCAAAEKRGRGVVRMAFEVSDDFEESLFRQAGAGEFVETGDDGGAQCATGAEAAGDGDVAGDLCVELNRRNFGAPKKEPGGFANDEG